MRDVVVDVKEPTVDTVNGTVSWLMVFGDGHTQRIHYTWPVVDLLKETLNHLFITKSF